MDSKDISKRIKELRHERGLTLEQVANVVGVGKSTVRKWETGMIANMKRDKIAPLAKVLHTTPSYLMGLDQSPDADFLDMLPTLKDKESLPPMLEAVNTLLYESGRQIMKVNNEYFLDECGQLSADEINDLINSIVISAKNAVDSLLAKKTKEVRDYLSKK